MRVFLTYIEGWVLALRQLKLWALLYLLNFFFALAVSFPAFQFLNEKLAHSVSLDKMSQRFDFTVFDDIMNQHGEVVGFISNQGVLTALLFLLLSVFLTGGILNVLRQGNQSIDSNGFWQGGAKFYWRIFFLTIIFLIFQVVILFLFYSLFNYLTDGGLERFHSEASIFRRAVIVFAIYSFFACICWMIQDYAKVIMVRRNGSLVSSLASAFKFVIRNFGSTFFLYLLNLLTIGLVYWIYWRTPTFSAIGLAFIIGQLVLIFRIGMKLLNLSTASIWYEKKQNTAEFS